MKTTFTLFVFYYLLSICIYAADGNRINISDTSVKKNFMDIDTYLANDNKDAFFVLAGWDDDGGGIYELDPQNIDNKYRILFEDKQKFLFSVKILNRQYRDYTNKIIIAGGYFSKCLCGTLLLKTSDTTDWQESVFDDTDYPFVSNIFCIATNCPANRRQYEYSRIFLGCSNGSIFYSDNNGKKFEKAIIFADNEDIKRIVFYNDSIGLALAGTDYYSCNKLYKTTDRGSTWFLINDYSKDAIILNDLVVFWDNNKVPDNIAFLLGSDGNKGIILSSVDYGKNFSTHPTQSMFNNLPSSVVSGAFIGSNSDLCAVIDNNGVLGVSINRSVFDFPYFSNEENYKIGKFTKFKNFDNLSIGCGYDGIVYLYGAPETNVRNKDDRNNLTYSFNNQNKTLSFVMNDFESIDFKNLKIFNLLGENIRILTFQPNNSFDVQLADLTPGIYFFMLNGKNSSISGKFLFY